MPIFLGADHGGFELKNQLLAWLKQDNQDVEDCGAYNFNSDDDYPDYAFAVANQVATHPGSLGILICRSGGGMAIAANKVRGIRAIVTDNVPETQLAREKNDANVISLAADWLSLEQAEAIIKTFLSTNFSQAERHVRRLAKIESQR